MASAFLPGAKVGRYEIRSKLGAGGMGEVYLARDLTLDRKVALKVLPENVASDRNRMQRFVQEAKAASGLNHPNIITIHEIGTEPGAHFIATEFIDGDNLRHHLRRTPVNLTEAIDIALQVASALASAHAAGIVHRDIKPENIMLRKDGIVKVLDFGLAKLTERSRKGEIDQDADTMMVQTEPGTIVGTTAYMSPEQARAQEIDPRTDIWSLGIVLYEMVTGQTPFRSETASDTSAAILRSEPPALSQHVPETPPELERIVRKALQKNREERYQGIRDMLLDLKTLKRDLDFGSPIERSATSPMHEGTPSVMSKALESVSVPSTQSSLLTVQIGGRNRTRLVVIALMLILVAGAAGGWFWWRHREADAGRFSALAVTQLVSRKNDLGEIEASHARFSPDGKFVAYASSRGDNGAIWLKQIGSGEPFTNHNEIGSVSSPVWSPDGLQIAVVAKRETQSGIWSMAAFGGTPTLLKSLDTNIRELVAWKSPGKIYFVMLNNLYALNVNSQEVSQVTRLDTAKSRDFATSQKEDRIAYNDTTDGQSDIWIMPMGGGSPVRVTNDKDQDSNPAWTPDGQSLIYSSKRNGIKQICLARLDGRPSVQLTVNDSNSEVLDVSGDGTRILYLTGRDECDLWSVNLDHPKELQITNDIGIELWPDVAPDGKTVVFQSTRAITSAAPFNSLLMSRSLISETSPNQLATDGFAPLWSPDGKQIAFLRYANGSNDLWLMHAAGGDAKPLTKGGIVFGGYTQIPYNRVQTHDFQWSPDSTRLIYCDTTSGAANVWQITHDGSSTTQLSNNADAKLHFFNPTWSPDGQRVAWLAVSTADKKPSWSVWLLAEGKQQQIIQSDNVLGLLGWSQSGQELVVKSIPGKASPPNAPVDVTLSALSVQSSKQRSLAQLQSTYFQNIKLAPAKNQIAFVTRKDGTDSLQLMAADGGATRTIMTSSDPRVYFSGIAWSPDGKTIFYGKQASWTMLSMIDNFK